MTTRLYLHDARIVDPAAGRDEHGDLYIVDGHIAPRPTALPPETERMDCSGLVVVPGLIDLHVHLREPGHEEAETVASGAEAAARGGFSTIVAMPNTRPPLDQPERVAATQRAGDRAGFAQVLSTGCITRDRAGHAVADLRALAAAGAVAFTDDGCTVQSDALMEEAMRTAYDLNLPIMDHAQDRLIELEGGVMHDGAASARLALPGIPTRAEARIIARDIGLAERTGCHLHIQHVSSAAGVALIRDARARGLRVSSEASPHHLALCDEDVAPDDTDFKMNPPLRAATDREAIRQAAADGVLDCFATDHAPHSAERKARGFREAPFGVVGLETAVGVTYTEMVATGRMDLPAWVARWTSGPARLLGWAPPTLAPGTPAHLAVLDLERRWMVDPAAFASRSRNTPFKGRSLQGRALLTMTHGRITWRAGASAR